MVSLPLRAVYNIIVGAMAVSTDWLPLVSIRAPQAQMCDRNKPPRYGGGRVTSANVYIDASMIQGSVVGPPSFIMCTSTLKPLHGLHRINVQYADDNYLLIGSNNIHTAQEEMANISKPWATTLDWIHLRRRWWYYGGERSVPPTPEIDHVMIWRQCLILAIIPILFGIFLKLGDMVLLR